MELNRSSLRMGFLLVPALACPASPVHAQPFGYTHRMLPLDGGATEAVAFGDLDGDGDLDVFVAGALRVCSNDGTGVFTDVTPTSLPTSLGTPTSVALGDVDGDGDLDAYLGTTGWPIGGQNRLLLNGAGGAFADVTATNLPALLGNTATVALGDVDGDGDLDAWAGGSFPGGTPIQLLLNGGTGVFTDVTATNLPALPGSTAAMALGDVDGDGDLDALVTNRLLLNGGAGTFADVTATNLPTLLGATSSVALGDVDGDGDLDAFLGGTGVGQNRLLLNGGTGIFTDVSTTNLPSSFGSAVAVALGDVDGDGDLDACVGYADLSGLLGWASLYPNGGTGVFAPASGFLSPELATSVALGDVDGDGDLDALLGNSQGPTFFPSGTQDFLLLNDGTGGFTNVTSANLPLLSDQTMAVALGDLDGDGDLDAFVGNSGPSGLGGWDTLCDNQGTGVFARAFLPLTDDFSTSVALGDVDGDGDLDAFVGNYANLVIPPPPGGQNCLYLNSGAGAFVEVTASNLPVLFDYTLSVALGDVDADGDLDAYAGNSGQPDRLYANSGGGVFADVTATNLPPGNGGALVALGDVDRDGDLDAFLANRLLLNAGTGGFTDVTAANLPAMGSVWFVALGDVDGDGDLDAFFGNRLLLNAGTGAFADAPATSLPTLGAFSMAGALGDMDGDGDLDAVLAGPSQRRLWVNDGAGVLADATAANLPPAFDWLSSVALGDVDGDGDLDAFLGARRSNGPGSDRAQDLLFTNLSSQLAWRGIPRAGKPLVLDLWGPGNGTWLLAASAGSASISVPSVGTLRLLPSTLFIVSGGVLDPQGRASVSFLVPANPALVGLSYYWQALVGPPPRFTNLEITTVTGL